jgi:hypothetical protein
MIFVNPIFTTLLNETEFDIEHVYIGSFYKNLSHIKTNEKEVVLERTPFLFNDRSNYILLNDNDETLIKSIKSLKLNYKILSIKVTKTNLSKYELKDTFKLIGIKNRSYKDLENNIKNIIIHGNYALNHLCKSKQKQLGYINKNILNKKLSSQTLSRINKDIDLYLCKKIIIEKNLFEIEEDKLKSILKRTKENSRTVFLSEIILNSIDLEMNSIYDIDLICNYITKNNLTRSFHYSLMKDLFSKLSEILKSPLPTKLLFQIISEIEDKRNERIENYNFFIDAWGNKDTDKSQIIDYFLGKMRASL